MLQIKKYLLFVLIISSTAVVLADEASKDCESAVDAADRLGSEINKECDYANQGLNGVLHRALAKKEDAAVDEKLGNKKSGNTKIVKTEVLLRIASARFSSAQQLTDLRYELIHKAAQECPAGFVVTEERYLPEPPLMKLEFIYSCL